MTPLLYVSLILLASVKTEEVTTPASFLGPRNFNHHPFDAEKYLKSLNLPVPTKQGPVLFPNDAPPPPRPPLIVTSRPLIESIARSELNPLPANSSVAESRVAFIPYLARVKDYKPFRFSDDYNNEGRSGRYNYEAQTALPPIYKAFSDHAQQNVAKIQQKPVHYGYQVKEPDYTHRRTNDIHDNNSGYDHNQNYEFSYTVKDKDTGDDFSHSQHSSGSATNGEYRVRLPDGRMQIVSYTADENGYNADVRYDDEDKTETNNINNDYGGNSNDYNDINNSYGRNNNNYLNNRYENNDNNKIYKDYIGNSNIYGGYDDNRNNFKVNKKISDDYGENRNSYISNNNVHNDYKDERTDYINDVDNNAQQKDLKLHSKEAGKDDYYNNYPDSKEYYNEDYSSENNGNYQPYTSKFLNLVTNNDVPENNYNNIQFVSSTVKPSYEELKDLFATKKIYNTQQNYDKPFDLNHLNALSTTKIPNFDVTTENVVLIGAKPNIYTNIRNIPVTASPATFNSAVPFIATTPRSYLVSTIANLRNRINSNKPVVSDRFIDKINKYLTFK